MRAAYKQDPVDLRTRKREDAPQSPSSSLPCAFAFLEEHNLVAVGLTTGEVLSILFICHSIFTGSISKVHIYRDEQLADVLR